MLKQIEFESPRSVKIADADKGAFFRDGLEYNPPARGGWNIVHTGLLIPEAHEIFACAQGCLRGVILTTAEMNAPDRLSWISLSEQDMFDGTLESDIVDGVADILSKLDEKPRAVLLYLSCMHLFAGCDYNAILSDIRTMFPDIDFTDCYMTPTMRKNASPDEKMRLRLYSLLKPLPVNNKSVSILGNDIAPDEESELFSIIKDGGFEVKDIHFCKTYDEYLKMAESFLNITTRPTAKKGGRRLAQRLGTEHIYLPACFDFDNIAKNYKLLCDKLGIDLPDLSPYKKKASNALKAAKEIIGDTPIAIDFLAVARQFELAELLLDYGFNVKYIIADGLNGEETAAFESVAEKCPELEIYSSVNVNMLTLADEPHEKVLAIGQKGAYYFNTDYFVNIVEGSGLYGYEGIKKLADMMADAYTAPKPHNEIIKLKGHTCESCLV